MKVRKIREEDYLKVVEWYADVAWPMPAVDGSMPKHGFVAEIEGTGELAGCIWISQDGSSAAELKWPATNPSLDPKAQNAALVALVREAQKMTAVIKPELRLLSLYTRSAALAEVMRQIGFRSKDKFIQLTWVREM